LIFFGSITANVQGFAMVGANINYSSINYCTF